MTAGGRRRIEISAIFALALIGAFAAPAGAQPAQSRGIYAPLPDMTTYRYNAAVAKLPNGGALVAGGAGSATLGPGPALQTTEVFDGRTRRFHPGPVMGEARGSAVAIPLPDGRVLVAAGAPDPGSEIYDPKSNSFSAGPAMTDVRFAPEVVDLGKGKFLIAGGTDNDVPVADSEIFDSRTMTFTRGPSMSAPHDGAIALALPDGRALIAGGYDASWHSSTSTDLYDPATGAFTAGPSLPTPFLGPSVPLADGTALLPFQGAIFDPKTFSYAPGTRYPSARSTGGYGMGVLEDGRILFAGGEEPWSHGFFPFNHAYLYEADGTFRARRAGRSLVVRIHAAGTLTVRGPRLKVARRTGGPGTLRIRLRWKSHAKSGSRRARTRVKIEFAPLGGSPTVKVKRIRLN